MTVEATVRILHARLTAARCTRIPTWDLDSGTDGPHLLLVAAQHGNEVQGSEVIRRFMRIAARTIVRGRISAVPFANPLAIRERRPHIGMPAGRPYEDDGGFNMNRAWPGRPDGTEIERIAHAIHAAYGRTATHVLDLHCWQKHNASGILLHDLPGMRELAAALGVRFVHIRPHKNITLAGHCGATGRIGITLEMAGQYTLREAEICNALRAALNLARLAGILSGPRFRPNGPVLFSDEHKRQSIIAPCTGLFRPGRFRPGDAVSAGDRLGVIMGGNRLEDRPVAAPAAGYLQCLGVSRPRCDVDLAGHHPWVARGDLLAVVWT